MTSLHYFNSQPHKEADFFLFAMIFLLVYFNSQPHKEADILEWEWYTDINTFQLTASQGGWRNEHSSWYWTKCISTHSLTRRLTHCLSSLKPLRGISTHSLTRRLTMKQTYYKLCLDYFNSQPHKEADGGESFWMESRDISTHSLTRRLTAISDKNIFIQNWFFYLLYILVLFFIQIIIF